MIIRIAWETTVMPVSAYDYFHSQCLLKRPEFESEAIAQGQWSELQESDVAPSAICSHCSKKLIERA